MLALLLGQHVPLRKSNSIRLFQEFLKPSEMQYFNIANRNQ